MKFNLFQFCPGALWELHIHDAGEEVREFVRIILNTPVMRRVGALMSDCKEVIEIAFFSPPSEEDVINAALSLETFLKT